MSFSIPFSMITEEIKKNIAIKCRIKPSASQYAENPPPIDCFRVSKETKEIFLPLGIWREYYKEFPNNFTLNTNFKTKSPLFTLKTDPKKYRDQDVVFNQAVTELKNNGHTFLSLATGFGKTCLGTQLSSFTKCKTLVICHLDKVNHQWKESFEKFTTAKVQIVKGNKLDETCDVYICGIKKALNIKDKLTTIGIGTVIFDEAQISTVSACIGILLHIKPRNLIGLSATPKRPDGLHALLELYFGDMKNFITRNEVKDFTVIKYITNIKPDVKYRLVRGKTTLDWTHIKNSLSYNDKRRKIIIELVRKYQKNKIMVLADRIETCKNLVEDLEMVGENVSGLYGNIKKHDSEARVLIASTSKAGVGFDQPGLDLLIITSDVKNVTQWEGRIRCSNNIVVDMVDDFSTLENHWKIREKWYQKRGATIKVEYFKV